MTQPSDTTRATPGDMTPDGRVTASLAAVTGFGLSVAANVASQLDMAPAPSVVRVIAAVAAPLVALLAVEVITRARGRDEWYWRALRYAGLTPVLAVAVVVSYLNMQRLFTIEHEHWFMIRFGPLAVDGLMLVSATGLAAATRVRAARWEPQPTVSPVYAAAALSDEPALLPSLADTIPPPTGRGGASPARAGTLRIVRSDAGQEPATSIPSARPDQPRLPGRLNDEQRAQIRTAFQRGQRSKAQLQALADLYQVSLRTVQRAVAEVREQAEHTTEGG